jgi:hypothetical protein
MMVSPSIKNLSPSKHHRALIRITGLFVATMGLDDLDGIRNIYLHYNTTATQVVTYRSNR